MTITGQWFGKHVPAATNRRGINTRCYEDRSLQTNSVQQTDKRHFPWLPLDYIRSRAQKNDSLPRVEVGSNTSSVALRVVGGDEKGSLESETVEYGHESHGTRTRE
jgi:hypothetical protein